MIDATDPRWIELFTGLSADRFKLLVREVARRGGAAVGDGRTGRQWSLPLAERVLLVACYYRTDLTMRRLAPLFGITRSAAGRIIDRLGPYLAVQPARRGKQHAVKEVLIRHPRLADLRVLINVHARLVVAVDTSRPDRTGGPAGPPVRDTYGTTTCGRSRSRPASRPAGTRPASGGRRSGGAADGA